MKRHSSSTRGADGIGVEVCHPYVVEARRGMLFEQTDEMPLRGMGNLDRGVPTFGLRGAARMRDVGKRGALVLCAETCTK